MINDPKIAERLKLLNCGVAIRYEAPSYVDDPLTGKARQKSTGGVHADVFEFTVKMTYASAQAENETAAILAALTAAEHSEKPLTPAQQADVDANRSRTKKLEDRIKELELKLAERNGPMPGPDLSPPTPAPVTVTTPAKRRGRPPKNPTPPTPAPESAPPPEAPAQESANTNAV